MELDPQQEMGGDFEVEDTKPTPVVEEDKRQNERKRIERDFIDLFSATDSMNEKLKSYPSSSDALAVRIVKLEEQNRTLVSFVKNIYALLKTDYDLREP